MLWSQVRVLSSILKLRHRIAAIAADCKSAVFRLRWFESNCLNKCSIRLTVRTQDFHSCNRGSVPRYCTKYDWFIQINKQIHQLWFEYLSSNLNIQMNHCLFCKKEIPSRNKYCDNHCQSEFRHQEWVKRWKEGKETGNRGEFLILIRKIFI